MSTDTFSYLFDIEFYVLPALVALILYGVSKK